MKVVINRCWGGFGLSAKATKMLVELQGRECHFFRNPKWDFDAYEAISVEEADDRKATFIWYAFDTPNVPERIPAEKWGAMPLKERAAHNEMWSKHSIEHGRELDRSDPKLVQVVEMLGDEASGSHAKLEIVEIPDGVDYEIDEYDGMEKIAEKHREWS